MYKCEKLLSKHGSRVHMKILYNKNDEKEIIASMGFEPGHTGKRMDLLLAATLLTDLSILTTNSFQNHT